MLSAGELSYGESDRVSPATVANSASPASSSQAQQTSPGTQTLSTAPLSTVYEFAPAPFKEVLSYSKGVQTSESWTGEHQTSAQGIAYEDDEFGPSTPRTPRNSKRLSRREREKDDELRESLRREVEEELRVLRELAPNGALEGGAVQPSLNVGTLTTEELEKVTASNEFLDFLDRSSKVIERALDEEYDILADYAVTGGLGVDAEEDERSGKGRRGIREVAQFWDEGWSKKRTISDLDFSPKVCTFCRSSLSQSDRADRVLLLLVPRASPVLPYQESLRSTLSRWLSAGPQSPSPHPS